MEQESQEHQLFFSDSKKFPSHINNMTWLKSNIQGEMFVHGEMDNLQLENFWADCFETFKIDYFYPRRGFPAKIEVLTLQQERGCTVLV